MTIKSLKTFQRNCIGGSAVSNYEKYLDDQIINLCMLEDLDELELEFSKKCRVPYSSFYSGGMDGIVDPKCVRSLARLKSIFISDYLFFTIGKSLHWSLCIVCKVFRGDGKRIIQKYTGQQLHILYTLSRFIAWITRLSANSCRNNFVSYPNLERLLYKK